MVIGIYPYFKSLIYVSLILAARKSSDFKQKKEEKDQIKLHY